MVVNLSKASQNASKECRRGNGFGIGVDVVFVLILWCFTSKLPDVKMGMRLLLPP